MSASIGLPALQTMPVFLIRQVEDNGPVAAELRVGSSSAVPGTFRPPSFRHWLLDRVGHLIGIEGSQFVVHHRRSIRGSSRGKFR